MNKLVKKNLGIFMPVFVSACILAFCDYSFSESYSTEMKASYYNEA